MTNRAAGVLKAVPNRSRGDAQDVEGPKPDAPGAAIQSNVYKVRGEGDGTPLDWPGPGPIDVRIHERPHASATTEWWYVNGHCETPDGRQFSLFAAFFRLAVGRDAQTGEHVYAHSVTWALSDIGRKRYLHFCGVDPSAPGEGLKRMRRGLGSRDNRLNRALAEILERGEVPTPDKVLRGRFFVADDKLELDYSGQCLYRQDDGTYRLVLSDEEKGFGCDVVIAPKKGPFRHGDDGVVRGPENEKMFYYFMPRCDLHGKVWTDGHAESVKGSAWHDHEFGVRPDEFPDDAAEAELAPEALAELQKERRARKEENLIGWNWLSAQLDDGTELTLYPLTYIKSGKSAGAWTIVIDAEGNRTTHSDFTLEPVESWQSTQTFAEYPVKWKCKIPSAGLELDVAAAFEDQEFITLISKSSFWEGRVDVSGTHGGKPVRGRGFVERSGFTIYESLDDYFNAVGRVVRKTVRQLIPLDPTYEQARRLVANEGHDQYMDGLDIEQYARTLIRPIRDIIDRGGKGWRSYAAITCCDIVGGDSRKFTDWLAVPEMMHVGSLIVDDVQDKSEVRRGAPTAHMIYGEAQAINSGTAAYFLGAALLGSENISDRNKIRIYNLYFESMRAGHAGQAIDLDGFEPLMPDIVESGKAKDLERRVLCVHRLKTAAPAGCLARMGAIAGGGTDEQVEGLGLFFEAVGLAFQIIDDVLNLRGFKGDLKQKGEDVSQGKITLPVAKALSRLPRDQRQWLWDTLRSKPSDYAVVKNVIDVLEDCGAIGDCEKEAREMVESAWQRLDPLVDDSLAKMMLRAFGWFVLERHY